MSQRGLRVSTELALLAAYAQHGAYHSLEGLVALLFARLALVLAFLSFRRHSWRARLSCINKCGTLCGSRMLRVVGEIAIFQKASLTTADSPAETASQTHNTGTNSHHRSISGLWGALRERRSRRPLKLVTVLVRSFLAWPVVVWTTRAATPWDCLF